MPLVRRVCRKTSGFPARNPALSLLIGTVHKSYEVFESCPQNANRFPSGVDFSGVGRISNPTLMKTLVSYVHWRREHGSSTPRTCKAERLVAHSFVAGRKTGARFAQLKGKLDGQLSYARIHSGTVDHAKRR